MTTLVFLRFLFVLSFGLKFVATNLIGNADNSYLDGANSCLDTRTHKVFPGPESDLFEYCAPWKERACCTMKTSETIHEQTGFLSLYNFNLNHCPDKQEALSEECVRHFKQDLCFYECEPNIGPWKVKVKRKIGTERFYHVPLCYSDCESWFNACRKDFTCTTNWPRHMNFSGGQGNRCPEKSTCRTFEEVYNNNASYFCNQVWDESFKVVPNSELCMRIWFDGSQGNPNYHTSMEYVKLIRSGGSRSAVPVTRAALVISLAYLTKIMLY